MTDYILNLFERYEVSNSLDPSLHGDSSSFHDRFTYVCRIRVSFSPPSLLAVEYPRTIPHTGHWGHITPPVTSNHSWFIFTTHLAPLFIALHGDAQNENVNLHNWKLWRATMGETLFESAILVEKLKEDKRKLVSQIYFLRKYVRKCHVFLRIFIIACSDILTKLPTCY